MNTEWNGKGKMYTLDNGKSYHQFVGLMENSKEYSIVYCFDDKEWYGVDVENCCYLSNDETQRLIGIFKLEDCV